MRMGITSVLCRVCGTACKASHDKNKPSKFCSRACYFAAKKGQRLPGMTPEQQAKASRRGVRNAAKKIRGTTQSEEHRAARIRASWRSLTSVPKPCRQCGAEFFRKAPSQRYCTGQCWLAAHRKKYKREKRFTIPAEHYQRLLNEQANCCAICGELSGSNGRNDRLAVDHCHDRMVVRGLLCHRCNTALGLFRDNVSTMERAIAYLRGS